MQRSSSDQSMRNVESGYWTEWQVPVCALIVLASATTSILLLIKEKRREIQPLRNCSLWIPCWRGLSPIWLLLYRALAFLCLAYMLYEIVAPSGVFGPLYFYTVWTFALVTLYFAVATVVSAEGCWRRCDKSDVVVDVDVEEQSKFLKKEVGEFGSMNMVKEKRYNEKAGILGSLLHMIYQVSSGAAVLTDILFWCLIVPLFSGKTFDLTLFIASMHILNIVFLIVDSGLNTIPFQCIGITFFVLWSFIYITYQWTLHAFFGFKEWPYPFLDLATSWAPLWYVGVLVFHIPCYGAYFMLINAKNALFYRFCPNSFTCMY